MGFIKFSNVQQLTGEKIPFFGFVKYNRLVQNTRVGNNRDLIIVKELIFIRLATIISEF